MQKDREWPADADAAAARAERIEIEERALDRCELVFRENVDAGVGILAAAFLAGFLTGFLASFLAGMGFLMAMSGEAER